MSRRIDIELTSNREDGTWTWRAAGAKQPKGVLPGSLLTAEAAVGDVLRAEVETTLDGTEVLGVTPPKAKHRPVEGLIELATKELKDDQLVTTTLAPKRGGGSRDRGDRGDRGDRPRGPRREGDRGPRREGGPRGDRPGGDRSGGPRSDRPGGDGPGGQRGPRPDRPHRERPAPPAKPKAKRLRPGRTHRKAALDLLAPEEQVIAEQVLRGGVPAVRQAVDKMNEEARAAGRPEVKPDALLAVAERLLPALRTAEWRDRAEAAVADLDELDLRDLRSVVVAADTGAKDDETRALAAQIREGLARRVDQEQAAWLAEIAETLGDGRVVRALRLSSRPPKAGAPLPAELAAKLSTAAGAALTADTIVDRWATVLDALSFSPVRLTVTPASRPETPSPELVAAVTRVAARIPKVAEAFGIEAPADAPRRRGGRPGAPGGRKGGPGGGAPRPPKPPKPPVADGAAPSPAEAAPATPPADAVETAEVVDTADVVETTQAADPVEVIEVIDAVVIEDAEGHIVAAEVTITETVITETVVTETTPVEAPEPEPAPEPPVAAEAPATAETPADESASADPDATA